MADPNTMRGTLWTARRPSTSSPIPVRATGVAAKLNRMDVAPLYRSADQMDEVAGILRARAALLASGAAGTRWYSPAARTYFEHIDDTTTRLIGCAHRASALADGVRTQALRVLADSP